MKRSSYSNLSFPFLSFHTSSILTIFSCVSFAFFYLFLFLFLFRFPLSCLSFFSPFPPLLSSSLLTPRLLVYFVLTFCLSFSNGIVLSNALSLSLSHPISLSLSLSRSLSLSPSRSLSPYLSLSLICDDTTLQVFFTCRVLGIS